MQSNESSDEARVREVIESWARAIGRGDRAAIIAHHSSDFLMFDLPDGIVRGIDEYVKTWDFFFKSPKGPISFVPSELKVTAGDSVAFASCLIHCEGTSAGPVDVRLTVGLCKIEGDWVVTHEHHSVPSHEERFSDPTASGKRST